jgi:hypothetical protein
MKNNLILRILRFSFFIVIGLTVAGYVVMWLWNTVVAPVFGIGVVNFWQALGLLVLGRLLFGNWGGNRHRYSPYARKKLMMHRKWAKMTPEQRHEFKRQWKEYCGKDTAD